jgi:hypothetical protein
MADLPIITVKQLKEQLAKLGPEWDSCEVQTWLPGTYIKLASVIVRNPSDPSHQGPILLEGNIIPGSALDVQF